MQKHKRYTNQLFAQDVRIAWFEFLVVLFSSEPPRSTLNNNLGNNVTEPFNLIR